MWASFFLPNRHCQNLTTEDAEKLSTFKVTFFEATEYFSEASVVSNDHRAFPHLTRVMYSRVRVSTRTVSPSSTKRGT